MQVPVHQGIVSILGATTVLVSLLTFPVRADLILEVSDDGGGGTLFTFANGTGVTTASFSTISQSAPGGTSGGLLNTGTDSVGVAGGAVSGDFNAGNNLRDTTGLWDFFSLSFSINFDNPVPAGTQVSELDGASFSYPMATMPFTNAQNLDGVTVGGNLLVDVGNITFSVVPEPSAITLFALGAACIFLRRSRC